MQNVLITGAAGFVSSYTAQHFIQNGWQVYGYDLQHPTTPIEGMIFIQGDILEPDQLERTVAKNNISSIVHQAGIIGDPLCQADPSRAVQVNVQGTSNLLEISRKHNLRFTFISTATLYGRDPSLRPLSEDDPTSPVGLYDATKLMGETLCFSYHKVYKLDVTTIRTSFVYGCGHNIGTYYLNQARANEPVNEESGADHPCEYTYVKDLARGIYLAHTVRPIKHRLFNIASGVQHPKKELIALVKKTYPNARIEVGPGISEKSNLRGPCLIDRAKAELGYKPEYTLETGFTDWLQELNRN